MSEFEKYLCPQCGTMQESLKAELARPDSSKRKRSVLVLKNQKESILEDTYVSFEETPSGKISITIKGEDTPNVFLEAYGEEVRILIYRDYEDDDNPETIVLDAVSGGW